MKIDYKEARLWILNNEGLYNRFINKIGKEEYEEHELKKYITSNFKTVVRLIQYINS